MTDSCDTNFQTQTTSFIRPYTEVVRAGTNRETVNANTGLSTLFSKSKQNRKVKTNSSKSILSGRKLLAVCSLFIFLSLGLIIYSFPILSFGQNVSAVESQAAIQKQGIKGRSVVETSNNDENNKEDELSTKEKTTETGSKIGMTPPQPSSTQGKKAQPIITAADYREEDSQRFMDYSKSNQRKADRQRRQKRIKKELQENNILKDIKKNPYLDDQYSYLTKDDLARVKKWRFIVGQDPTKQSSLADEERAYYQQKYNIDKYQEKPFCLIIPTFNNKPRKRAQRNIRSILMQQYNNYHFIVIDDGSVDGTGELIQNYLSAQKIVSPDRYKVVIHTERSFSVRNIREAARNFCKPEDILIVVDGDDELLGRQVLKLFNAVYSEKGVWFMYTNFLGSIGRVGYSRPYHPSIIEENAYRDYSFAVSHLRSYYTKLLLNVKDEDLQDENGNFFTSAGDMAITIPCLEQAHKRVAYVPEMTYYYNFNTGLNVHRKRLNEQRANNLKIRQKKPYKALEKLFD